MDREQAKETVKSYLGDYLKQQGINTRRAFNCLNPAHSDKNPSMSYDRNRKRCKCFSCGVSYDIFDLIGIDYGLTDDKEIFKKAYELYNISVEASHNLNYQQSRAEQKQPVKPAEDNTAYYKRVNAAIAGSPAEAYLTNRGISTETANKYLLGYDREYKTFNLDQEGQQSFSTWEALIIPTGKNSFVIRNIATDAEKKNRYRKKGSSLIFNSRALYNANKPIFVVEGEIDAISIIEAEGEAIGLGSTSNTRQLIELIKHKAPAQALILSLDQDEEGQKAEEALSKELEALAIPFYRFNPCGIAKDANEALIKDMEAFKSEIRKAEHIQEEMLKAAADAEKEAYYKTNAAGHLESFLNGIKDSVNTPVIKTGFNNLDMVLDGGLYEGLYVVGAISSLGKTTLALQLMDQIAQQGYDVLIFSLEMARNELIAKSISRNTYLLADNKSEAKTTRGITSGARYAHYSEREKVLINAAVNKYREYAKHIYIHEGIGNIGIEQIKETVQQHISITGNKPVILIDYLQIMAPYDMRSTDKQNTDKAVLELKRLSRDNKVPVIGISSFNRDSYKDGSANRGKVSQADFKESGAIEYSADVLCGLEFAAAGEQGYAEKNEKKKNPRNIRLVVMKNRNGKAWESAEFKYYPLFNYFEESESEFIPAGADADIFQQTRKQKAK